LGDFACTGCQQIAIYWWRFLLVALWIWPSEPREALLFLFPAPAASLALILRLVRLIVLESSLVSAKCSKIFF
jgi:hypothetical protein